MNEILDIFYNEIIYEAAKGRVECFFTYNTIFDTIISGKKVTNIITNYPRVFPPTLIINNREKFNQLLIEYVMLALDFYKDNQLEDETDKVFLKSIMTLLWSDATSVDFANPEEYLRRRINFLKDKTLLNFPTQRFATSIGNLMVNVRREQLYNETPYYTEFSIDGYPLPLIKCAISDGKAYIYAIQNSKLPRDKKLNRALYKVNEGIDLSQEESDNINHPENLKGVTPSTLLSAALMISLLKSQGISEIIIPVMLISRWNAKEIATYLKSKEYCQERREEYLNENKEMHDIIQRNLSDKFIRTFRRLEYHFSNIEITAIPFLNDIDMHIEVGDELECNNPLLKEMYQCFNNGLKR